MGEGGCRYAEMPEMAEAQALLAALSQTDEVKATIDARKQRVALQMAYASAHLHAGGPGAPQATATFARARDLAAVNEDAPERLSAYYGLWVSHFARGELAQAREVTNSMLRDFESGSGSQDYSLIHRAIGMNCYAAGQYLDARRHLEESVASYSAERDRAPPFASASIRASHRSAFLRLLFGRWATSMRRVACRRRRHRACTTTKPCSHPGLCAQHDRRSRRHAPQFL